MVYCFLVGYEGKKMNTSVKCMNKYINKTLLAGYLLCAAGGASAETVVLAADVWCPINCEPASATPGYMIEIAKKALETAGHTLEYRVLPWSRAIEEARRGDIDGIIGAYQYDVPDFVFPEVAQGLLNDVFYVKRDSTWQYNGVASLSTISLAVVQDYGYTDELNPYVQENLNNNARIQVASGDDALNSNIRKLLKGRVDALVESAPVFWFVAAQLGVTEQVKEAGQTTEKARVFIAFSPQKAQSKTYAKLIADTTQALRASGELATLLAKYNLRDWQ